MTTDVMDRAAIAAAISDEIDAMPEAPAAQDTPPPADPAPAETKAEEPTQGDTPAPVAAKQDDQPPQPLALNDKTLVQDADGQMREWGQIKAERLRHADYTRKTMELAEQRRAFEAQRAQVLAEQEAAKLKAATPDLPEDDPYAIRIKAVEAAQNAMAARIEAERVALEQARMVAAQEELAAIEKRMSDEYKFDPREIAFVEQQFTARSQMGETVTLGALAKEFHEYKEALKREGEKEWKERHSAPAPAAKPNVPSGGVSHEMPAVGTKQHRESLMEELKALIGR